MTEEYILLVSGDAALAEQWKHALRHRRNYRFTHAPTGAEADRVMSETPPDAVVLDTATPGAEDFCRRWTKERPFLAMGEKGDTETETRWLAAGCPMYNGLPFDHSIFALQLNALLNNSRGRMRAAPSNAGN